LGWIWICATILTALGVLALLTDATHNAGIEGRWNQVGVLLGAGAPLEDLHVEGIIVAGGLEQQLALLDTSGVLQRIVHHCKAEEESLESNGLAHKLISEWSHWLHKRQTPQAQRRH